MQHSRGQQSQSPIGSVDSELANIYWPRQHHLLIKAFDPGPDIAFLTVANARFSRGLEAMLLSLKAIYPELSSPVFVLHDGSYGAFLQRRLLAIHPLLQFVEPDTSWAEHIPRDTRNRRRIGLLGYLNGYALSLRGFRRVLVLDCDLLITGALDPLWGEGDAFRAVPDCGARPWAEVSAHTGRPVINSGVISLPGWALNDALQARFASLIPKAAEPVCPLLDRFADQKVWNLLLADQLLDLFPVNYNCNVKYLVQFLGGCAEALSVVHFAGPKPWLTWPWVEPEPQEQRPGAVVDHLFWNRHYRQQLMAWRLDLAAQHAAGSAPLPPGPARLAIHPLQLVACAGVSRHLLLPHADLFGEGWPDQACWPEGWLSALESAAPLRLWAPMEWEPALRHLSVPAGCQWCWLPIEAPFSPPLDQGVDRIAADGPWQGGFEPWSEPLLPALEWSVKRHLQAAGAHPVQGP